MYNSYSRRLVNLFADLNVSCDIRLEDARHTSILGESIDVIITSPPYVTSYEYADIHQLTGYWMEYISDLREFRKQFIGTSYSGNTSLEVTGSCLARSIVDALYEKFTDKFKFHMKDILSISSDIFKNIEENYEN